MSRINDCYDYDEFSELHLGRWARNSRTTVESKRGQQALREIETALLALPTPRLAYSIFDDGTDCCVLGAYARHKGVEAPKTLGDPEEYEDPADETARFAAARLGLRYTLAWNLMFENDESCRSATPEERYAYVLAWVRQRIRPDA